MPIQDKNLGKYTRPGIFIEEVDASVIQLPIQDVLINLVPGFSRKGPVNTPVYITNTTDFKTIFGDIDNNLERKGSYFHRTCLKMLNSGPIYALNLLSTDDTRDFLQWESVSCSSYYDNDVVKTMPYSRAFNRQDFWKKDSESFLDYVNDPTPDINRVLHLTNMGKNTNTVFIFKSATQGFDVSLEEWYGGLTKVPAFLHPKNLASDYLVSVLILDGDWTDYNNLSVSTNWNKYFDNTGLIKTNIQDFVNEPLVSVLSYYDASLIPYFTDNTGRNMYVKTLINNDTDKTGLFCAYNDETLLESDYPNGTLDILGEGLVKQEKTYIDFMSYKESIIESKIYAEQKLDDNNNVFGNYSIDLNYDFNNLSTDYRSATATNGFIENAKIGATGSTLIQVNDFVNSGVSAYVWLDIALSGATCTPIGIPSPQVMLQVGDAVYFNQTIQNINAYQLYYVVTIQQGGNQIQVSTQKGGIPLTLVPTGGCGSPVVSGNLYVQRVTIGLDIINPNNAYFNIDGTSYTFDTGNTTVVFEPLQFDTVTLGLNRYDVLYLEKGNLGTVQVLKGTQSASAASKPSFTLNPSEYIILGYAKLTLANVTNPLSVSTKYTVNVAYKTVALDDTFYVPLTNIVCSGVTVGSSNYVQITFNGTSGVTDLTDYNKIRTRQVYTEIEAMISSLKGVIINKTDGSKLAITSYNAFDYSTTSNAIIRINVGSNNPDNYFYANYKFLLYYIDNEFVIGVSSTDRLITSLLPVENLTTSGQTGAAGVIGKYSNIYLDFYNGVINSFDYGYVDNITGGTKIYLKMWTENDTTVYMDFVSDTTGISPEPITNWVANYNSELVIWSDKNNYKQTIEIENLDTTKLPNLIYQISVDKTRYSEIGVGSYLEAYWDDTTLNSGEVARKMVRVIQTTIDSTNTNWKILQTDAPINIAKYTKVGGSGYDYATMAYPSIDIYVSTYKGIKLAPFVISSDSIPNKTEARLSSILDVINKTTKLAKGLANKNKISWRYLVDSFGLGLTANSKQQLVDVCGLKLNCLGFINMPSAKSFKKSSNPSFINDADLTLNTAFVKTGGDQSKSPSYLYSFGKGVGATCSAYFFPYMTIDNNGFPEDVPPAMFAATTYMQKFLTNQAGIEAWTIAAGQTDGMITGIGGLEFECSDDDITNLNQMGANPIVKKKNGFNIETENTAKPFPYSSLSLIHSREVLIELENSIYDLLLQYQWKFNTPEVRSEIKFKADKICKDLKDRDALYNYLNIMDERNNTNFIIDLQMGCIDTYIEIIKGMGIIVNNITILKKGDIESGGFA